MMLHIFLLIFANSAFQQDSGSVERLINLLGAEHIEDREAAEARLVELRAFARPALESALRSADAETRGRARQVLAKIEQAEERDARHRWVESFATLEKGMEKEKVREAIKRARKKDSCPTDRSWSYSEGDNEGTDIDVYDLDGTWHLVTTFRDSTPSRLESHEVIGFPDLRPEVDPSLYRFVRILHESPSVSGNGFNPVALLRAANALHSLGAQDVLRVCEAYESLINGKMRYLNAALPEELEACRAAGRRRSRYNFDEQRIFLVLRIIFVRVDGKPDMPVMRIGSPTGIPYEEAHAQFPLFPLALQDSIPFMLADGYILTGKAESSLVHVQYCREHCALRPKAIAPGVNPVEAADRLVGLPAWAKVFGGTRRNSVAGLIRVQALQALSAIYVPQHGSFETLSHRVLNQSEDWREEANAALRLNPRWDPARQKFVSVP